MRIFKNKWFSKFARKEGIADAELREAARQLEAGLADASLGGDVYKVRIARPGEGKSGGYRVIVFFRSEHRTFFIYGFAKSGRENIDFGELRAFKEDARFQLALTDAQISAWLKQGTLIEVQQEAGG
jgi:hypothetical protein